MFGAKKGQSNQQKPNIAKDTTASTNYAKILYGLCEGEIYGLAEGHKSIRLDGTPIINDNGQANFGGVKVDFRTGTLDQEYISGFPAVENESNVGVELRHDRAWTKAINNTQLSAVRVRLAWNALREQKDNGDIVGYKIEYAIDVQTDGGAFIPVLTTLIHDKASQGYKRSHRIDLPKAKNGWTIRVRRITPNRDSELIGDTMYVDALTEIIDAKLTYAGTAMLGLQYDAETFSNIAKVAIRLKGKLLQVPTNYDTETRTYSGLWDGTFKLAYSNNPAWVYYDLCTNKRYALGERLQGMIDKWSLYSLAQYCDEMVDDGKGGREPRFVCNVYIQKLENAYALLQSIASIFRAMSYWNGEQIIVDSDTPKDPVYTFSRANVVGGNFTYSGTRARDRHTIAKVAWDNPDNEYKTEYEFVRDERAIAKYGIRMLDINILGCTSRGQAQRAGLWALKTEQLETRTVTFKTGLDGFIPQVGQIINIADDIFAGRANGGRVVSVSKDKRMITLDREATGQTLVINGTDGKAYRSVINRIDGMIVHLASPIDAVAGAVWAMESDDLRLMQFRVLSIKQDGTTFDIQALQYEPQKFDAIDAGAIIKQAPFSVLKIGSLPAPAQVLLRSSQRVVQGQNITTLSIDFEQVEGAVAYRVEWRKDDNAWIALPKTASQSIDIDNVYSGNYQARVRAIDAFDNESLATTSELTAITGKVGKPPRPARLTATGKLFGMDLTWSFNAGSGDTNYTEIQVSPDGRSNIATLGTFAYPTDKHTINGLQGNLRQFYRARIVDKLGNVSDWTAWVSGTTEAQADKVLSLLTGQITASQLHQDLSTPIGKIGTLENSVNTAKIDLSALNASMTTAKADIAKAKTDLSAAVSNITTERNRISSAIRDITTLQSANNAKTLELANLTQTVGSHTSSIRDLAVTTGELSQRYTQLKTASDSANSEITAIKQTQNGQAVQIDRLQSRYTDNLLSSHDAVTTANYLMANIPLHRTLAQGQMVVITVYADLGDDRTGLTLSNTTPHGASALHRFSKMDNGVYQAVVPWNVGVGANNSVLIYHTPQTATSSSTLHHAHIALADAMSAQTNANIATMQQTLSSADQALSSRIDTLDASYKSADNTLNASITAEQKARADGDTALSQRVTALDAAYKQADTTLNASITAEQQARADGDTALSQRVTALDAAYKQADTTLNASITAEQQARTNADNALSQRVTALDSAYKSADSALSARVATAEQSITTANQAIAQTQETLMAKMDVIDTNLVISGSVSSANYNIARFNLAKAPKHGEAITITLWGELGADRTHFGVYNSGSSALIGRLVQVGDGMYQLSAPWTTRNSNGTQASNTALWVYQFASTATSTSRIDKIRLEYDIQAQATSAMQANLDEFKRTESQANGALSQRIDDLNTSLGTKANAAALNDLSTKVNQVDGKINATAQKVSTLQTTVNGQTASIEQHSQSINGLSAQWTLKAESNGIVSGIGLASSNGVSDFAVRADKFYVASPIGTTKQPLFSVLTTATTVGGVSVPAGVYLSSAYIQNGTITNAHIANGAITTAKIGNAQIGNAQIANGAITTAKIGTAQVDTLQIKGEAVIVPRLQYSPHDFEFRTIDTEEEINRISIDAKGGSVSLQLSIESLTARSGGNNDGSNGRVIIRIKRNGTVLRTINLDGGMTSYTTSTGLGDNQRIETKVYKQLKYEFVTLATLIDTPPAGDNVYTVTLESRGLNSGLSSQDQAPHPVIIKARSFQILGVCR